MPIDSTRNAAGGMAGRGQNDLRRLTGQVKTSAAAAGHGPDPKDTIDRLNHAVEQPLTADGKAAKRKQTVEAMNELIFGTMFKMMLDKMYESGKAMRENTRFDGGYAEGVFTDFMSDAVAKQMAHSMGETPLVQMALDARARVDSSRLKPQRSPEGRIERHPGPVREVGQTLDVES